MDAIEKADLDWIRVNWKWIVDNFMLAVQNAFSYTVRDVSLLTRAGRVANVELIP